jgi:methylthioribulose-1-phosphate dehydratase
MLTLLLPRTAKSFKISHMEMIKGMRLAGTGKALAYFDTLEIPIIENTADEEDLTGGMETAMREYPESGVVLVRQHGSYNWGKWTHRWRVDLRSFQLIRIHIPIPLP